MKYTRIIVTHHVGPDTVQVLEKECPESKEGEVRVRVLGWDLIAVVERIGEGVSGIKLG